MDEFFFKERVVWVTGGTRGIGRAIALRFGQAGCHVFLNHRQDTPRARQRAEATCLEIRRMGVSAEARRADISERQAVRDMAAHLRHRFGRLDFLVLNAARAPFKPVERMLERDLRLLVGTNFLGHVYCVQETLPLLAEAGGKIVFISSLGSRFYSPAYPLGPLKAAMEALVRDLSETLRDRGVNVNAVCGGLVKTDSYRLFRLFMEGSESIPESLFTRAEEIAEVVVFLCSPNAGGIRGQTIVVDRGLSHRPLSGILPG